MGDFDKAVAFLGDWGLFQIIIFAFYFTSMVPNGFTLGIVFVADTPKHQCFIPQVNLSQDWLQALIPVNVVNGEEQRSSCSRYRLDAVSDLWAQGFAPGDVNLTQLQQEPCVNGWTYSKDIYQSTIVTEFDIVCSDQWKQPLTTTVYFSGILLGSFVLGQVSDSVGRKPVFFATMAFQALCMFAQAFSSSWIMFTTFIFFTGIGHIGNLVSSFVLGAEILIGRARIMFTTLGVGLAFATGYMMVPLMAYFLRNWKYLQMAMALPSLVYLPFWWFIPESPRWLLSQGRVEEAEAIMQKAAHMNKVKAPVVIFKDFDETGDQEAKHEKHHSLLDLFRTSNIRRTTIILCLLWFSMCTGYYGVSLNTSKLTPDPYLGSLLSAAMEVPASLCVWFGLKYLPRRILVGGSLFIGGTSILLKMAIPPMLLWLTVTMEMIGKFGFSASMTLLFAYTSEVFPTVLRNTAMGICSTFSRLGSCLSPFILQLSLISSFLPSLVMGLLAAVSSIGAAFLPETYKKPLSETIPEMQQCKGIHFPCLVKKEKTPNNIVRMESKL